MSTPGHGHHLRKGRVSIKHQVYMVTIVTRGRRPLLEHLQNGRIVVCSLWFAEMSGDASTLAYVVMPDHVHWLMSLGKTQPLSAVVGRMKRFTSRRLNLHTGNTGRSVWQRGFHDHALRKEEDIRSVARYIVANPIRAGLVKRVGDYPLWDAVWL